MKQEKNKKQNTTTLNQNKNLFDVENKANKDNKNQTTKEYK